MNKIKFEYTDRIFNKLEEVFAQEKRKIFCFDEKKGFGWKEVEFTTHLMKFQALDSDIVWTSSASADLEKYPELAGARLIKYEEIEASILI